MPASNGLFSGQRSSARLDVQCLGSTEEEWQPLRNAKGRGLRRGRGCGLRRRRYSRRGRRRRHHWRRGAALGNYQELDLRARPVGSCGGLGAADGLAQLHEAECLPGVCGAGQRQRRLGHDGLDASCAVGRPRQEAEAKIARYGHRRPRANGQLADTLVRYEHSHRTVGIHDEKREESAAIALYAETQFGAILDRAPRPFERQPDLGA
jgi:hypothetical protein